MAGRPRSLDDAKRQTILNALSQGLGRNTAAAIAETSITTIRREMERNPTFRQQVKKAEATCEDIAVQRIRNAKEWQASAWFLERKWPQKWGAVKREPPQPKEPDLPDNDPPGLA